MKFLLFLYKIIFCIIIIIINYYNILENFSKYNIIIDLVIKDFIAI